MLFRWRQSLRVFSLEHSGAFCDTFLKTSAGRSCTKESRELTAGLWVLSITQASSKCIGSSLCPAEPGCDELAG